MPNFHPKLIIIDDEPIIVELVTAIVARCGYDVRNAFDGEEAVSIAKKFQPDCVVTGIFMPRMGGFEEATAILQFLPSCKFIFMSASAHDPKVRAEYERLGFDFRLLLGKPFKVIELLNALSLVNYPCSDGP